MSGLFIVDDPHFDEHRSETPHPERPDRLRACRQGIADTGTPLEPIATRLATPDELNAIHDGSYIEQLLSLSGQQGHFDEDTYFGPRSVEAARLASGGTLELTEALWSSRGRGVALLRPPGHHARPGQAMGFCLLNHVALAAARARTLGASRVAIVDWDVHHGNGTEEAFYQDPSVLYISIHQSPLYPGTGAATDQGAQEGRGYNVNVPLAAGATDTVYDEVFRRVVEPIIAEYRPEFLFVSAGFDAHARDPLANMLLSDAGFGSMTQSLLRAAGSIPLAVLLEGGYDLTALQASMATTLRALARSEAPPEPAQGTRPPLGEIAREQLERIEQVCRLQANFWPGLV